LQIKSASICVIKAIHKHIVIELIWFVTIPPAKGRHASLSYSLCVCIILFKQSVQATLIIQVALFFMSTLFTFVGLGLGHFHFCKLRQLGVVLGASALLCLSSDHATGYWLSHAYPSSSSPSLTAHIDTPTKVQQNKDHTPQDPPSHSKSCSAVKVTVRSELIAVVPTTSNLAAAAVPTQTTTAAPVRVPQQDRLPGGFTAAPTAIGPVVLRSGCQGCIRERVALRNYGGAEEWRAVHRAIVLKLGRCMGTAHVFV
jgi:hypothetical protein